ncbi:MAG: type II toxin-antitoxin system RelB/DinJ family antitoxin [Desulfobacterium sp.]|jgi:DNA-damage-inducible protein J|nr:type II toxin-antitoxin system RelB/DinJ family antitoxin [Desulfobacterium sp.]
MAKTAMTHTRITPEIKTDAERIIKGLGLSISAAHELFYRQIITHKGLPFDLRILNEDTIQAMDEAKDGVGKKYDSVTDMFDDITN